MHKWSLYLVVFFSLQRGMLMKSRTTMYVLATILGMLLFSLAL